MMMDCSLPIGQSWICGIGEVEDVMGYCWYMVWERVSACVLVVVKEGGGGCVGIDINTCNELVATRW